MKTNHVKIVISERAGNEVNGRKKKKKTSKGESQQDTVGEKLG